MPIPHADADQKTAIGDLAIELQQLHSAYRDGVQELTRLINHEQMLPDTSRQTPRWPWPGLPEVETLKKSDAAKATGLKGAALTRWANEQKQTATDQKLLKLSARLIPSVHLDVTAKGCEIALHADGIEMLSVFESLKDVPLIAAQWRQVLRTTSITPSLSAQKLLDRLLALRTTDVPALRQGVVDADTALVLKRVAIDKRETEINQMIYGLYGLEEAEIRRIEQG